MNKLLFSSLMAGLFFFGHPAEAVNCGMKESHNEVVICQAQFDLPCSKYDIDVHRVSGGAYRAVGCEKQADYMVTCPHATRGVLTFCQANKQGEVASTKAPCEEGDEECQKAAAESSKEEEKSVVESLFGF